MALELVTHTGSDQVTVTALVDDTVAAWVAGGADVERISCTDSPGSFADAVGSPSLFANERHLVVNLDGIAIDELERVEQRGSFSTTRVVAHGSDLSAAQRKILGRIGALETHTAPKANQAVAQIVRLAELSGVSLDGPARAVLAERCGHDLARARSVLRALAAGGYRTPTPAQIRVLSGTTSPDGVPWDVTDALDRGDLAGAIDAARRCEPVAVIAYLSSRVLDAARLQERPGVDPVEVLGGSPWTARRSEALARRLGPAATLRLVHELARADREVKLAGDSGPVVLERTLARWVATVSTLPSSSN